MSMRDVLLRFLQHRTELELVVLTSNSLATSDEYAQLRKVKVVDVGSDVVQFAELHLSEREYVNYTVFFDHFVRLDSIQRIVVYQNPFEADARNDRNWSNLKQLNFGRGKQDK